MLVELSRGKTYGVPEPVRGGREGNTAGTDRQREDLANDDPSTGTPGRGEEENEDGNESNLCVDSTDVVGTRDGHTRGIKTDVVRVVETDRDTDDGDEELADKHAQSAIDKQRTSSKLLNCEEGDGGGADVDQGENQRDQESVANSTSGLEEGRRVVEDEVDT